MDDNPYEAPATQGTNPEPDSSLLANVALALLAVALGVAFFAALFAVAIIIWSLFRA